MRELTGHWHTVAAALTAMGESLGNRDSNLTERIAQMDAMLGSMIEGVIATDAEGRVLLANEAACDMLSRPSRELVGHRLMDTVRYTSLRTAVEEAQLTRTARTTEVETFAGPRRLLLASVTALSAPSRGGLAVVMHDITEVRKMETMRRDFVANVSHELKTPLAVIKACAETLLMGALHDDHVNTGFVEQIETQADSLDQQVQRLLDLSQAQSGAAEIEIQPVDINGACRQVVDAFLAEAEKRNVELVVEASGELLVDSDEDVVHAILNNLISNALRYTPAGGRVNVGTSRTSQQVVIEVRDTGIGIAPENQERVFERFFRVDKSRSRDQGGTGLGLAIVKHGAQSLGGSIELKSQIGKGSTFRLVLPDNR
jgi:two-component system phosphate regulon sensor histidine kinase PhoR